MKSKAAETRYCKNNNCKKPLPEGYNYKYCEGCRNDRIGNTKKAIKVIGGAALSVVAVVSSGKKH